ncbi:MAG: OB-fold nucleic acid binding domain-containing protein [Candidatus Hermodarchaeota archaeon]
MSLEEIVEKIIEKTGLSRKDIQDKIKAKVEELDFFVTERGAAHIVANELGVEIEKRVVQPAVSSSGSISIKDLHSMEPQPSVNIIGRVVRIYSPRSFKSKDRSGSLQRLIIADKTSTIAVVLWGRTELINQNALKRGDVLRIIKGYTKDAWKQSGKELHVGTNTKLQVNPEGFPPNDFPAPTTVNLSEITEVSEDIDVKGVVKSISKISTFEKSSGEEGRVGSLRLIDKEGQTRITFWDDMTAQLEKLSPGDELLIEGVQTRPNRDGEIELQTSQRTHITMLGKKSIPQEPVNFVQLSEITESSSNITVEARIGGFGSTTSFEKSDGSQGYVSRLLIYDETGTIQLVLWDDYASMMQNLKKGQGVRIDNGYAKKNMYDNLELHIGRNGDFTTSATVKVPKDLPITEVSKVDPKAGSVCIEGVTIEDATIREVTVSSGEKRTVANVRLQDMSGWIRLVGWQDDAQKIGSLKGQTYVKVEFGNPRTRKAGDGDQDIVELFIGRYTTITPEKAIPDKFKNLPTQFVSTPRKYPRKDLNAVVADEFVEIRAKVLRIFDSRPPYYHSCPECRRRVTLEGEKTICSVHGEVKAEPYILLAFVIDDGYANMRASMIGRPAESALNNMTGKELSDMGDEEAYEKIREILMEKELLFSGKIVERPPFNEDQETSLEMRVYQISSADAKAEADRLMDLLKERE